MADSLSRRKKKVNENLSYHVNLKLGEGSSSTVYKGTFNGKDVAVKRLDKKTLTDDDKRLLLSIKHENIVQILSSTETDEFCEHDYIVLELCLASLYEYIEKYETISSKFSELNFKMDVIIKDAVKGLEYLHEKSIVHRDIKPGNILLVQKSSSSEVKAVLSDFGICVTLNDDLNSIITQAARGTNTWKAPELLLPDTTQRKCSRESDIFAMGCVIYFVETDGNHPFDKGHDDDFAIHQNVINNTMCDFRLLDDKQKAVNLIRKMICHQKTSRPSASEVLKDPYFEEDRPLGGNDDPKGNKGKGKEQSKHTASATGIKTQATLSNSQPTGQQVVFQAEQNGLNVSMSLEVSPTGTTTAEFKATANPSASITKQERDIVGSDGTDSSDPVQIHADPMINPLSSVEKQEDDSLCNQATELASGNTPEKSSSESHFSTNGIDDPPEHHVEAISPETSSNTALSGSSSSETVPAEPPDLTTGQQDLSQVEQQLTTGPNDESPPEESSPTDLPKVKAEDVKERVFDYNDEIIYPMNKSPRGYCLIIHMSGKPKVDNPEERDREPGNGADVKNLKKLFEKNLNFVVKEYPNLTKGDIDKLMEKVKNANLKWSCCFVMLILAHGGTSEDGSAYFIAPELETRKNSNGEDEENLIYTEYKVSTIKKQIENHHDLVGKPKLLFLQTCRGNKEDCGALEVADKDDTITKEPQPIKGLIPTGSDFLIAFPTIEGYVAWRSKGGSRFIWSLCKVFRKCHKKCDILTMMTIVTKRVADMSGTGNEVRKQNPAITSTLRKLLYFGEPPCAPISVDEYQDLCKENDSCEENDLCEEKAVNHSQ